MARSHDRADVKGASAEGAQLRMLLLTDDDRLRQLSDDLIADRASSLCQPDQTLAIMRV
jgi:hypothetical protein